MSTPVFNLIRFLKIDKKTFYDVLKKPDKEKYKTFYIKKRTGGKRLIEAPIDQNLIAIQNKIKDWLEKEYEKFASPYVFGYLRRKSIRDNAAQHFVDGVDTFVVKMDIKDFFNSITFIRISNLIHKGLNKTKASSNAIALFLTKDKHLPQGACTSPVVSNMICKKMDKELSFFARKHNGIYSRYADDMFFSFHSKDNALGIVVKDKAGKYKVCNELSDIIIKNGFTINERKVQLLSPENSQNICGIIINKRLNTRRRIIRDVRVELHKIEAGDKSISLKMVVGKISFLRFIRGRNDSLSNNYALRINQLMEPPFPDANFIIDVKKALDKYIVRIEPTNYVSDYGTAFFSKGFLITSKHVIEREEDKYIPGLRGYYKDITIFYYNDQGVFEKKNAKVIDAFLINEITFLKIDVIDSFKNKFLKISSPFDTVPTKALCCGCQICDNSGLGIMYDYRQVLGLNEYYGINGFTLQRGSIVKCMSGGPLLDIHTFKVIGVNFQGHKLDNYDSLNSVASRLDTTLFKNKIKWKPDELWVLKNKKWQSE